MSFDVGLPAIIKSESIAQLEMEDIQYHKGEYKVISWVEYTLLCWKQKHSTSEWPNH